MNMNSAYETVMISPSAAAPPVPPITAEQLMIVSDNQMDIDDYESHGLSLFLPKRINILFGYYTMYSQLSCHKCVV